jgi:hypothetical protein
MPLDYKNTDDGDLLFDNGDLVIHDATTQHQKDILIAAKGDYREFPDVGVDLINWLDDDALGDLPAAIQEEFEKDGMTVTKVQVTESGKTEIEASYD